MRDILAQTIDLEFISVRLDQIRQIRNLMATQELHNF